MYTLPHSGPSGIPSLPFLWKEAGREPYLRNDGLHFLVGPQGFPAGTPAGRERAGNPEPLLSLIFFIQTFFPNPVL